MESRLGILTGLVLGEGLVVTIAAHINRASDPITWGIALAFAIIYGILLVFLVYRWFFAD